MADIDTFTLILLLMAVGFGLILLEFLIPGGVAGVCGAIAMGGGCYLIYKKYGELYGIAAIFGSIVITAMMVYVFFKWGPGQNLFLDYEQNDSASYRSSAEVFDDLMGGRGAALTTLRPAGIADFDGRRVDVVADCNFIEKGRPVRVVAVEGNRVVVEADDEE